MKRIRFSYIWPILVVVSFAVAQTFLITSSGASGNAPASAHPATTYQPNEIAASAASPLMATFTVNTADDHDDTTCTAGDCSLREAINAANASAGADTIAFSIGSGAKTINLTSALPSITGTVTLDGTSQPGFSSAPLIELNGVGITAVVNGLTLATSGCTVKGLIINRFKGNGITVQGSGNVITGNYIGLNST